MQVNAKQTPYMILRSKIESFFVRMGRVVYANRMKTLLTAFLITGAICSQLPKLSVDTSALGLIAGHDPIRLAYEE